MRMYSLTANISNNQECIYLELKLKLEIIFIMLFFISMCVEYTWEQISNLDAEICKKHAN